MSTKQKKTATISIAAAIIILAAVYAASVNIKLLFDTETHITVTPSISSITQEGKEPANTTFATTVEKLAVCEVSCTHTLTRANDEKTINQTTAEARGQTTTTYQLPIREGGGSGQEVYNYEVSCTTTSTPLCPSKGKNYTRTAMITLNHGLSAQEETLQATVREELRRTTTTLAEARTDTENARAAIDALTPHADVSALALRAATTSLAAEQEAREEALILSTWKREQYAETAALLERHEQRLTTLAHEARNLQKETKEASRAYEQAANATKTAHNLSAMASGWTGLLSATAPADHTDLLRANDTYRLLTTSRQPPSTLAAGALIITQALAEAAQAYTHANAQRAAERARLQATYEETLLAHNETWPSTDCEGLQAALEELRAHNETAPDLQAHLDTYCPLPQDTRLFTAKPLEPPTLPATTTASPTPIPDPQPECCYRDECKACAEPARTPLVLVHGHSFSKSTSPELAFTRLANLQARLQEDGYLNAGTINAQADLSSVPAGDWGRQPAPAAVGVTYYYLNYYDLGELRFVTRKTDSIENYAIRLKEAIDTVKEKTGAEEVTVVAHSMGGLVAREYLALFGDEDVDKLILLGTPNKGVEGDIRKYCTLTGAEQECAEMAAGSTFMRRLNEGEQPDHARIYTIRAEGCPTDTDEGDKEPGDGVVLARSAALEEAEENLVVKGNCTDLLRTSLHMDFVNPELYPETYKALLAVLKED